MAIDPVRAEITSVLIDSMRWPNPNLLLSSLLLAFHLCDVVDLDWMVVLLGERKARQVGILVRRMKTDIVHTCIAVVRFLLAFMVRLLLTKLQKIVINLVKPAITVSRATPNAHSRRSFPLETIVRRQNRNSLFDKTLEPWQQLGRIRQHTGWKRG